MIDLAVCDSKFALICCFCMCVCVCVLHLRGMWGALFCSANPVLCSAGNKQSEVHGRVTSQSNPIANL